MKPKEMSDSAFLKWAKAEDGAPVTAGSLRGALEKSETKTPEHSVPVMKFAVGALITLAPADFHSNGCKKKVVFFLAEAEARK
jgi:hypothetical protein